MRLLTWVVGSLLCLQVAGVSKSKFRNCASTGFCKRNRDAGQFRPQRWKIDSSSVQYEKGVLRADILNGRHPLQTPLDLEVHILTSGSARVTINEKKPVHPRYTVRDVLEPLEDDMTAKCDTTTDATTCTWADNELRIAHSPLEIALWQDGVQVLVANKRRKLMLEPYRNEKNPRPEPPTPDKEEDAEEKEGEEKSAEDTVADTVEAVAEASVLELADADLALPYDGEGMWDERFDGHTDDKPRGPSAVALDFSFVDSEFLYGIPEHATDFALKNTDGSDGYSEPYRLYNLDVFEYELDVPMALYGAVPFIISHTEDRTTAMLWLNAAETYIDVRDAPSGKDTHWISESGVIDFFLLPGPSPYDIFHQYAALTGTPAMPQSFAIGYHQCRWNYKDEADVSNVDAGFDEHDIPYDVLWLDIEHTDGKKYMTWDSVAFPHPKEMQAKISAKGRKMVTIVDPHIKRDNNYYVHTEASSQDLYIKNKDGNTYEGHCWPGSVSYLDFCQEKVREYWRNLFAFDKYEGSTVDLYVWNDMNEPSVFNGPEVSMPKTCLHNDGVNEHRDVHNMYGFYHQMATAQGLEKRDNARPFVLTRSFFAGSQRYGAVWTGDNKASWDHLEAATPMLLSMNVAGITFSGADVGGFFGDPDQELLVRWYQAAAFHPFFRGHAHVDAKRREPWLFGDHNTDLMRTAIRRRYAMLPYIYTVFQQAAVSGLPVMRPMWLEFPQDTKLFGVETQFLLGPSVLVRPIVTKNTKQANIAFPGEDFWYHLETFVRYTGGRDTVVAADEGSIPYFIRGGHIIAKRERARRSSAAQRFDPFTLVVGVDAKGHAEGRLYLDDGKSFNYQSGAYLETRFEFDGKVLRSTVVHAGLEDECTVERVVILGLSDSTSASVQVGSSKYEVQVLPGKDAGVNMLTIRHPNTPIKQDWSITLH